MIKPNDVVQKFISKQMGASEIREFLLANNINPARIVAVGVSASGNAHVIYAEAPLVDTDEVKLEGSFLSGMHYLSAILKTSLGLIAEGARELIELSTFSGVVDAVDETVLGETGKDLFFATPADTQIATFVRSSLGVWARCFAVGIDAFGIRPLPQGGYVAARGRGIIHIGDAALKAAFSGTPIEVKLFTVVTLQGTARGEFLSPITRVSRMCGATIIARLRDDRSEIVSLKHLTPDRLHGEVMKAVDADVEVIGVAAQTKLLTTLKTTRDRGLRLSYIPVAQAPLFQPYLGV